MQTGESTHRSRAMIVMCAIGLAFSCSMRAQSTGSIRGLVIDESGAFTPGARVELSNPERDRIGPTRPIPVASTCSASCSPTSTASAWRHRIPRLCRRGHRSLPVGQQAGMDVKLTTGEGRHLRGVGGQSLERRIRQQQRWRRVTAAAASGPASTASTYCPLFSKNVYRQGHCFGGRVEPVRC